MRLFDCIYCGDENRQYYSKNVDLKYLCIDGECDYGKKNYIEKDDILLTKEIEELEENKKPIEVELIEPNNIKCKICNQCYSNKFSHYKDENNIVKYLCNDCFKGENKPKFFCHKVKILECKNLCGKSIVIEKHIKGEYNCISCSSI